MSQLQDRVALITGGARGFGRAIALALAAEGANVAVSDIARANASRTYYDMAGRADLDQTVDEVRAIGRRSIGIIADVTSAADCERMAQETLAEFGRIDILVANAGIWTRGRAWEITEAEWDLVLDVNLKGAFLTAKYVVPHMIERRSGKIVFTSSIGGLKAYAGLANYIAAKHGVTGFMKALAIELGPYEINVNAIAPAQMGRLDEGGESKPDAHETNLLHDMGVPRFADVAAGVVWLVSDAARMVTGHTLPMDNGWIVKRGG
jgi:NAD(P)-dependent dehydrogenase (short-subunit alcohol dehydrogenase family)